jgi:hypothetical protein
MKLLTKEIKEKLPQLYSQEKKTPEQVKVIVKFFTPWTNWTWYATEFDGDDQFFGFVRGLDAELGYFSLSELKRIKGPGGLKIERDLYFGEEHTLAEVMVKQI